MNVAWFSPLPPDRSGIAAYSAELLPLLAARGLAIETFTADNARDYVWKARRQPYDLTVYHLGNASCHDYMWAYLFRYPGVVVLHDAQLHQARALWLTRRWQPRREDYLAEFRANHPDAPADAGELVAAGLGGSLYQHWPFVRLVIERARLTIVHNRRLQQDLRARHPSAAIEHVAMGVSDPLAPRPPAPRPVGVPGGLVIAAVGGITPEKRIGRLIRAVSALADRHPTLHLLLVGAASPHYDARDEARRWRVADRVHLPGYVPDEALGAYLSAADVCACLRWPSNRETSASWLRCLAAGRPTIVTALADLVDVPTVDPRGWQRLDAGAPAGERRPPVAVGIDLLDEQHSLELALDRLASDAALRTAIGDAGRAWWSAHHRLEPMADAYARVLTRARTLPEPAGALPAHLQADGTDRARRTAARFDVGARLRDLWS